MSVLNFCQLINIFSMLECPKKIQDLLYLLIAMIKGGYCRT